MVAQTPSSSLVRTFENGIVITKTIIREGIYQFTVKSDGYVEQLNSVAIVNENDVLVYDTFTRPSCAAAVLQEIRKITSKPIRYVVNSHWHPDHWSGNEVYVSAFPGLDIIASAKTADFMRHAAPAWPARFANILAGRKSALAEALTSGRNSDGTPFTPIQQRETEAGIRLYEDFVAEATRVTRTYPTLTYENTLTITHGGREFVFITLMGDSAENTVLYLNNEKILLTGDVIVYPISYGTPLPSQRVKDLNRILNDLDVDVIIPGHGPAMRDKTYVKLLRDLFQAITVQVRNALQSGAADLKQVRAAVNVEGYRTSFTKGDGQLNAAFDSLVDGVIRRSIREAREQDY